MQHPACWSAEDYAETNKKIVWNLKQIIVQLKF